MSDVFTLVPGCLTLIDLKKLLFDKPKLKLAESSLECINSAQQMVQSILDNDQTVYGINTGFGALAHTKISVEKLQQLQKNIVLSHACGTGVLLSDDLVSLILLLKINSLARGYSGVRIELIEALITLYNAQIYPCIPSKGSVGASGDLAPLAHLALPLIGEGYVRYQNHIISALDGLNIAGLKPMELAPKEGLALLNGLQASAAIGLAAYFDAERLFETAIVAGSLSVDAAAGSDVPFDARIHQVRGYPSQQAVATKYRQLLAGSEIRASHRTCDRVQDPYSLRCQPQIMGAVWHQMQFVSQTLEIEANSVSDNPLLFSEDNAVLSGGNFHGEMIAMAADNLALAIAEIGANAERRIALLIDSNYSGLPAFLVQESGLNSGFMIAHVTAAACASQNKALAHPHSVDSLPTSANQEDIVSMATNGALRLENMIDNTATILAIELLAACQGLEFRKPLKTANKLQDVYETVRHYVKPYEHDRYFAPDIAIMKEHVLNGTFLQE